MAPWLVLLLGAATGRRSRTLSESHWPPNSACASDRCSEQVHLSLGGADEMVVVFTTLNRETPSEVRWWAVGETAQQVARGSASTYAALQYVEPMLTMPIVGRAGADAAMLRRLQNASQPAARPPEVDADDGVAYGLGMYNNPAMFYDAPSIHTVVLKPLASGAEYAYSVAGDDREFRFRMPPAAGEAYPLLFGLTADLGQTAASEASVSKLRRMMAGAPVHAGVVIIAGDLAYADGWHSRWDSFSRMLEPLAASHPVMTAGGNHEVSYGEAWIGYNARYPMPHRESNSRSNLWWSREVGPAHLTSLCSYCAYHPGSLQYEWLLRDMAQVNRTRTPWLIVTLHVPFYHSNSAHVDEAAGMRASMEGLLYAAGVDVVLAGHVHAFERTHPMHERRPNRCGPVHLNLGDGGNREGTTLPWLHPAPDWSAFREGSFGVGGLTLINATHAIFNWSRTACETQYAPDHIDLSPLCESVALGPLSFGRDEPKTGGAVEDFVWVVRDAVREPKAAGCAPPFSGTWFELPSQTPPTGMRAGTATATPHRGQGAWLLQEQFRVAAVATAAAASDGYDDVLQSTSEAPPGPPSPASRSAPSGSGLPRLGLSEALLAVFAAALSLGLIAFALRTSWASKPCRAARTYTPSKPPLCHSMPWSRSPSPLDALPVAAGAAGGGHAYVEAPC